MQKDLIKRVFTDPRYFIAYGGGSGLLPWMPGTWGTLLAIPLYLLIASLSWPAYLFFVLILATIAAWLSDILSKKMGTHDDPSINIDEFVGFLVTMFAAPHSWLAIALGFGFFRFFDILKPWPISWADKNIGGGIGMVFDDILAGIAAALLLQLTRLLGII